MSGVNRRLITLESSLADRIGALEARMAGLEDRVERLADHLRTVETGLNSLILLGQRIARAQGLKKPAT